MREEDDPGVVYQAAVLPDEVLVLAFNTQALSRLPSSVATALHDAAHAHDGRGDAPRPCPPGA